MRYPNLIFDLDDTLIESFPAYANMHQRIAAELGWRVPSRAELIHYGPTWEATLRRLWPDHSLDPFLARYEEIAEDHPYPALPGVPQALAQLRERGHRLFIVTKRSRLRLDQRMRQAGLARGLFDGIFADEDQPASKPDPRCFEPIWQLLGERAHGRSIYVGDRADDLGAAEAAGVTFVGVCTGPEHGEASFLHQLPRERVLASAAALPEWLERARHG